MYTPNKKELKELGFYHTKEQRTSHSSFNKELIATIRYVPSMGPWYIEDIPVQIKTIEDLKTLIRLLTPTK